MKICVVTAFPPERGNLAEYGYYLVEGLAEKEKIEKIVVLANGEDSPDLSKSDKIEVVRCWRSNDKSSIFNIIREVQKQKPDLVLFNCHMMSWGKGKVISFMGALLPLLLKKLFRHKVVLVLHNIVEAVDFEPLKKKPSKIDLFGATLATKSMLSADKVIVTLEHFVDLLEKKYNKSNIVHIPHPTWGKKSVKISANDKKVLTFGFWRDTKGLPLLLESFEELKRLDEELKLIVAGESHPNFSGYLEDVKKKYGDIPGVTYTGYVPDEKLDEVFGSASIVVLPYLASTGSSGVVHMSASYGRPVVITDLPDMKRMAEEEGLEMLFFPLGDKEGLKTAIKSLLNDKELRKKIVENNLRVAEELSFSRVADRYVEVFENVLGNKPK